MLNVIFHYFRLLYSASITIVKYFVFLHYFNDVSV